MVQSVNKLRFQERWVRGYQFGASYSGYYSSLHQIAADQRDITHPTKPVLFTDGTIRFRKLEDFLKEEGIKTNEVGRRYT